MIINSKYDFGSTVWLSRTYTEKPVSGVVTKIYVEIDHKQESISYSLLLENGRSCLHSEENCYDSAQAVIEKVRKNFDEIIANMSESVASSESVTSSNESDSSH